MSTSCEALAKPLLEAPETTETTEKHGEKSGFGDKSIGTFSSICLLANNITGPGMVQIPSTFQQSGWIFPTIMFVYVGGLMGVVSMYLSKAVIMLPGNKNFEKRVEFNELAKAVFPKWLYIITMVCLIFNFQATNISSIVVSAQTMDNTLLAIAKKTCAIVIYPPEKPICIDYQGQGSVTDSPFGDKYVLSLGYAVTLALTVPLGFINLEDNMWVQQGGFVLLVFCIVAWVALFFHMGLQTANMPVNDFTGWGPVISTVVFNFGFVSTIPSWLNEKSPKVSVAKATWMSVGISGTMFLLLGIFGGFALSAAGNADLLAAIVGDSDSSAVQTVAVVACYIFPSAALLSGIPVFSIIVRYNLLNEGVPKFWANAFAVAFPWIVALAFYAGDLLGNLINWSSAILFVLLNLTFPVLIYIVRKLEIQKALEKEGLTGITTHDPFMQETSFSLNAAVHRTSFEIDTDKRSLTGGHGPNANADDIGSVATNGNPDIEELPRFLRCCTPMTAAKIILGTSVVLAIITFALQCYSAANPNGN